MLTLKHLCREYDVDPYKARSALREAGLEPPLRKQWKWLETPDSEEMKNSLKLARDTLLKISGPKRYVSPSSSTDDGSTDHERGAASPVSLGLAYGASFIPKKKKASRKPNPEATGQEET